MPKDKSTGKKLADMMYGNPERAAFGVFPQMKPKRSKQDPEAAKNFPVDLARGVVAGALGIPGDIESLARLPYELYTGNDSPTILPTSEDVLKRIPFGSDTPASQFAAGLGTLAGGSANLGAIPRAVKAAPGALKTAARNISEPRTLNPQAGVIKPKGGNWLGGRLMGNMDENVKRLKPYRKAGAQAEWQQKELEGAQASLERLKNDKYTSPRMVELQQGVVDEIKKKIAINNWVESNLGKYVKNQMATPEDPIRLLLDKRTKEIEAKHAKDLQRAERVAQRAMDEPDPRRQANMIRESERLKMEANVERQFAMDSIIPSRMQDYSPEADYYLKQRRQEAGFPAEGMGESEAAKRYETLTDDAISSIRAGDVQDVTKLDEEIRRAEDEFRTYRLDMSKRFDERLRNAGLSDKDRSVLNEKTRDKEKASILNDGKYDELMAGLNKLNTRFDQRAFDAGQENPFIDKLDPETQLYSGNTADMGFDHVIDILKQDVMEGRIRPEQLNKVSVEDAVRRTMEFDQEAARKMAEAQIKNMEGFPVYKEYPEGYRWVELKKPEDLPEGYSLDEMGNVVDEKGHLTNHPGEKRLEEALKYEGDTMGHCVGGYCPDVLEGKSRIFSLRDARGEPHVTVEVGPAQGRTSYDDMQAIYNQAQEEANASNFATTGEFNNFYNDRVKELQFALIDKQKAELPERIVQIKGKQNAAPKAEYLPYVQDFVKSGTYSEVGDLRNTGLLRKSDLIDKFSPDELDSTGVGEYLTKGEYDDLLLKALNSRSPGLTDELGLTTPPPEGMAQGGPVHHTNNLGTYDMNNQDLNKPSGGRVHFSNNPDTMMLELAGGGGVRMQGGGKPKRVIDAGAKVYKALKDMIAPKGVDPIVVRTPEEQAVLDKFGQKQEQEAVRQKKVEKAARESAGKSPEVSSKPAKSTGKRVAVPPDVYRKMADEQGDDAVLKAARAGKHLKPTAEGYIGAPRTVTSGQGLGAMRRAMDTDFADSVEAVRLADEARLGTWYDRAKQGIAESSELYQLPRTLEQHGVYSAGVSPESELTFALKHLNSRVAGNPQMAYRGAGMRNLDSAVAEDRPANMGFKIGEYANKNDPRIPNTGLFGVNDFRRAQGMGYTDPQGNPWKAGVSDTMHPFMDAETALQVDRANAAGTGGRTDWQGPHIQEVPWVYGKAQDLYNRGKRGQYKGDELEGMKMALRDANNTARDYMYKHAASATSETIPGASLGHVRQALDMTPEEKIAYGQTGRFDVPSPEAALSEFPEVGAGNRDSIYGALGYRQLPTRQAEGLYINRLGGVETNPMTIARPLMDFPTGGIGLMAPDSRRVMDTAEQFRALMDAQEAGAYNLPNTMGGVKGKNSMVLDTRGRNPDALNDPSAGVLPTSEQLARMNEVAGNYGFGVTASNRGAVMFPFDYAMDPKEASKAMRKSSKALEGIFPSSQEKSLSTMGYVPGVGKRSPEGPLSTLPYSGEATSDMLRAFSELPPTVSQNLSESEAVREAIRAKALRDSKMGGTRGDIQETRRFFSEADWPKAVELIRRGMTPAAALAALGYNVNAMAADER
jgi:hypothetical protein